MLHDHPFKWYIDGPDAVPGDRLSLKQIKDMPLGALKEDPQGILVFLPPAGHRYYDGDQEVEIVIEQIRKLMKKLERTPR